MKIAFLVSTFYPCVGGMGKVAMQEARELSSLGNEVKVFTLDYGDAQTIDLGFSVQRVKSVFKFGDAGVVFGLFWCLKDFDIIHLHYPFFGSDWAVLAAKLFWRRPYVITYHMDAKSTGWIKNFLQKIYNLFFRKLLFKHASAVIMVDQDRGQFFCADLISTDKKYFLPNPIDTKTFTRAVDVSKTDQKMILFVGNFLPVKRIDLIFQAMRQIPDLFLVLVGGGYAEKELKILAEKLHIADRIKWYGYAKTDGELAEIYSYIDCTVVASDYESFSLVSAESMACGTPVIGSSADGVKQRIAPEIDGLIFEKGNIDDLVKIIKHFFSLSREQQMRMGECGREKIVKENNVDNHIGALSKIYEHATNVIPAKAGIHGTTI